MTEEQKEIARLKRMLRIKDRHILNLKNDYKSMTIGLKEALKAVLFAQQHLIGQFDEDDLAAVAKATGILKNAGAL